MRSIIPFLVLSLCITAPSTSHSQNTAKTTITQGKDNTIVKAPITPPALPDFISSATVTAPVDDVTLSWNFTADKIVIAGGRFKNGVNVTSLTHVLVHPRVTTRYKLFVLSHTPANGTANTKGVETHHAMYSLVVNVVHLPPMENYHSVRGWGIRNVVGWDKFNIKLPNMPADSLVFFQPKMDSELRMAVSTVVMGANQTLDNFCQMVEADVPSHYDSIQQLTLQPLTYHGLNADLLRFSALDDSHPGTRVMEEALIVMDGTDGYVVSGRMALDKVEKDGMLLDSLIHSFIPAKLYQHIADKDVSH